MSRPRPCTWCGLTYGGIPEGSRSDRETCRSACKKALQRRRRAQLTIAGVLAEHVQDVIAASNPPVPSTTAATGEATP